MNTQDALLACLPPSAYDRQGALVRAEAGAAGVVIDGSIALADVVLAEHQPGQTTIALQDWERNHNLPDPCAGADDTLSARRAALLSRISGRGNLSRQFMIDQAARLGFEGATVTEFGPMTCADPCDCPLNPQEIVGVWRLNLPVSTAVVLMTCADPCDSPLARWGNEQLECVINRRKPAHTTVLLAFAA